MELKFENLEVKSNVVFLQVHVTCSRVLAKKLELNPTVVVNVVAYKSNQ
jgi:hypothetical protein